MAFCLTRYIIILTVYNLKREGGGGKSEKFSQKDVYSHCKKRVEGANIQGQVVLQ
jgi:hypothetical protein